MNSLSTPQRRANILRYSFTLPPASPRTASVLMSALGYHVMRCNGRLVDPTRALEPGRQSNTRVFASTFDLLPFLKPGNNELSFALGNGWSSSSGNQPGATQRPPSLYITGNVTVAAAVAAAVTAAVATSSSSVSVVPLRSAVSAAWASSAGALTYDSVYNGESWDFTLLEGAAPAQWVPVVGAVAAGKAVTLQTRPPVVELMRLPAKSVRIANRSLPPRNTKQAAQTSVPVYLVDFGQNIAGVVRPVLQSPLPQVILAVDSLNKPLSSGAAARAAGAGRRAENCGAALRGAEPRPALK